MYRRIEFITEWWDPGAWQDSRYGFNATKNGICFGPAGGWKTQDAWIHALRGPSGSLPRNAKFYFTELGWREVGRRVIKAAQSEGARYRVVTVKEDTVSVVWRCRATGYEVAAQPKKRRERR